MNNNFLKISVLFFGTLFFTTNLILCNKNNVTFSKEDKSKPCCSPYLYRNNCYDTKKTALLLRGDLLYWRGSLCGLEGAFGNTKIKIEDSFCKKKTTLTECDKEPCFKWRAGFRIGADLLFNCFDLGSEWTHFHGFADHSDCAQYINKQYGDWRIKYDTIDMTLGYNFYPCSHVCIKPFFGIRAADIDQYLKSNSETTRTDLGLTSSIITCMNDKENFQGVGPLVGVEVDWYLGHNFSLYCTFDAVTFYGDIHAQYDHTDTLTKAISVNCISRDSCLNAIGTDALIGIRWDKHLSSNFLIMIKLGLEQHRIYEFSNLGSDGSLSLDGFILEAGVKFRF